MKNSISHHYHRCALDTEGLLANRGSLQNVLERLSCVAEVEKDHLAAIPPPQAAHSLAVWKSLLFTLYTW